MGLKKKNKVPTGPHWEADLKKTEQKELVWRDDKTHLSRGRSVRQIAGNEPRTSSGWP